MSAPVADIDEVLAPRQERDNFEEPVAPLPESRAGERTPPLRLILHPAEIEQQEIALLPVLTTAGDVREVVQYLKKKPNGVSISGAMEDVKRRVFEPKKIAAYEFWGIVAPQEGGGDRLQLTRLGWEFARKLEPAAEAYRNVLDGVAPYRCVLEWMHLENLDLVTHIEVAARWQELCFTGIHQDKKTLEGNVVCFFHLCQAGGLGTMTIGKRGQPARLRVERDELADFITGRTPPAQPVSPGVEKEIFSRLSPPSDSVVQRTKVAAAESMRFLILCPAVKKLHDQLQAALELAGIESRFLDVSETGELIASGETLQAMRQCAAAIVVVTDDDCCEDGAGGCVLKQNILIRINSAFVLYDRRVALLWESRFPVPDCLASLPHCTFEGDELTWDVGVRLMRVIKEFQGLARRSDARRDECGAG
ncbi:MAG: hypothetical protein ACR2G4_18020 [Pyrinomonadaceae bacterium]